MKRFLLFLSALAVLSCAKPQPQAFQVIPMPDQVTVNDGTFCVKGAAVHFDDDLDEASAAAFVLWTPLKRPPAPSANGPKAA